MLLLLPLACRRTQPVVETKVTPEAPVAASTSVATAAPAPSSSAGCSPEHEASARSLSADATKAAAAKDWAKASTAYDAALRTLGDCPGPLEARLLGERGYVKLRAKDFDGARADLNAARDMATDDDVLGAVHYNLALVADAKKEPRVAFEETALSLGFRPNATVKERASGPCGSSIRSDEAPGVRYANAAAACKALERSCGADASAASLCEDGKYPCVVQNGGDVTAPWSADLPNDEVAGPAAALSVVDKGDGDSVYVYPAGLRAASWRCGGAGEPVLKVSGSVILVVYDGSTGAGVAGPGCDTTGYGVASYAAISTKRRRSTSFLSLTLAGKAVCP